MGLARVAGLPARDLYGICVAPSRFGYKGLGAGSADVSKAQHCRRRLAGRARLDADGRGARRADRRLRGQLDRLQPCARSNAPPALPARQSAFSCILKARSPACVSTASNRLRSRYQNSRARNLNLGVSGWGVGSSSAPLTRNEADGAKILHPPQFNPNFPAARLGARM